MKLVNFTRVFVKEINSSDLVISDEISLISPKIPIYVLCRNTGTAEMYKICTKTDLFLVLTDLK